MPGCVETRRVCDRLVLPVCVPSPSSPHASRTCRFFLLHDHYRGVTQANATYVGVVLVCACAHSSPWHVTWCAQVSSDAGRACNARRGHWSLPQHSEGSIAHALGVSSTRATGRVFRAAVCGRITCVGTARRIRPGVLHRQWRVPRASAPCTGLQWQVWWSIGK